MTRTPDISTYHREGIAVNVKDRHYWPGDPVAGPAIEELGESLAESIYEQVRMQFWDDAEELARDHGYDHVYSTGRQGGWLYVTDRGRGVDIDYDRWADGAYGPCDEWEQFERDEWQRFATDTGSESHRAGASITHRLHSGTHGKTQPPPGHRRRPRTARATPTRRERRGG